ncbi:MAG: DUF1311 domain-containing protein [Deltaproteobacteria bacterium]|jgi:uncharacterized protein YecT (DUF1311 family)|nr:DUF1311 domain-containing protein [Deltaproteobacteria bacterium]
MSLKSWIVIVALVLTPQTVWAQLSPPPISPEFFTCIEEGGIRERAMCISTEFELQEKRVNDLYEQLSLTLSEPRKQVLRQAQSSWIKYKEDWSLFMSTNAEEEDSSITEENIRLFQLLATATHAKNLATQLPFDARAKSLTDSSK